MKTINLEYNVYTVKELKEQFPKGFEKALDNHRNSLYEDTFTSDEVFSSLKAFISACGFKLVDWNLGAYNRSNNLRVSGQEEIEELTGRRAFSWLENHVLAQYRVPFKGQRRAEVSKYGQGYRPGQVSPCPFTGVCFDEDFLNDFKDSLKVGMTIKDSLQSLDSVYSRLVEDDLEYRSKEESFIEEAEANEWYFKSNGGME